MGSPQQGRAAHRRLPWPGSDSPVSGSGDFGIDAVIYTPPLDYNWRGFAGGGYANGDFEEGRGTYRWARAGAQ